MSQLVIVKKVFPQQNVLWSPSHFWDLKKNFFYIALWLFQSQIGCLHVALLTDGASAENETETWSGLVLPSVHAPFSRWRHRSSRFIWWPRDGAVEVPVASLSPGPLFVHGRSFVDPPPPPPHEPHYSNALWPPTHQLTHGVFMLLAPWIVTGRS